MRFLPLLSVIAFTTTISCQEKPCTQMAEDWHYFINATSSTQTFSLMVNRWGTVYNKIVALDISTEQQPVQFENYTYEKRPYYHGKIDFSPEKPNCSETEVGTASSVQIEDPGITNLKLCFQMPSGDKIYVVDKTSSCPPETSELIRW